MKSIKSPKGIIVLEGADGSGKTTLARYFVEKYGARYLHGRIFPNMWKYHVAMVRLALRWADDGLVVIDRLWLSELIYSQTYRGSPAYDLGARCLDRVLQRVGAITIVCSPLEQEKQLARHAERANKGLEAFQNVREVIALYSDLVNGNLARPGEGYLAQLTRYGDYTARRDVVTYDLDRHGDTKATFAKRVFKQIDELRAGQLPAALVSNNQNFVGNLTTAKVVLVGDAVSPVAEIYSARGPRWPFCWHDGLSAATWLNRALHKFGHDETTVIMTNANDEDCHLSQLIGHGDLKFVALGIKARKRLLEYGCTPDAVLEHPQFHRRFHAGELSDYAIRLRKAIREPSYA